MNTLYLKNFILHGIIGLFCLTTIQFGVNQFEIRKQNIAEALIQERIQEIKDAPTSDYFDYKMIRAESKTISIGEPLLMFSESVWHVQGDVSWNDILRCDYFDGEGYVYKSVSNTNAIQYNPERGLGVWSVEPWMYDGTLPERESECFVEANVTMNEPEHGVPKHLQIISGPFNFKKTL